MLLFSADQSFQLPLCLHPSRLGYKSDIFIEISELKSSFQCTVITYVSSCEKIALVMQNRVLKDMPLKHVKDCFPVLKDF
jgi:hypothetical protein